MFCKKCGAELREGATFCMKCGAKVTEEGTEQVYDNIDVKQSQQTDSKNALPFILLGVVIVILAGVIIWLILGRKDTSDSADMNDRSTTDIQTMQVTSDEGQTQEPVSTEAQAYTQTEMQSEPQPEEVEAEEETEPQPETVAVESVDNGVEDVYTKFGINPDTEENLALNLNPDEYLTYNSGISDFYFSYPANLFNIVYFDQEPWEYEYGMKNIQRIDFISSNGSDLSFRLTQRTDSLSIEEAMSNYLYVTELVLVQEKTILQNTVKEDYGKMVFTGYTDAYDCSIYTVIKVELDYVLEMSVTLPIYMSEEDKLQEGYITECLYRLCGFSGSSKLPQTYEEYRAYWENQ